MQRHADFRRTKTYRSCVLLILLIFFSLPVLSADLAPLQTFDAEYALLKDGYEIGIVDRKLQRNSGKLLYTSSARTTGIMAVFVHDKIHESSHLQEMPALQPLEYKYSRRGGKKEERYHVLFDWKNNKTLYRHDDSSHTLKADAADLLSFQLQLMQLAASGEKLFHFHIALPEEVREYRFKTTGTETLEFNPSGITTLRIEQISDENSEHFTLWLAPRLGYVPVQIQRRKNGKLTELKLRRLNSEYFNEPSEEY